MNRAELIELAERVEAAGHNDNALDVLVEIALFRPDKRFIAIRANAAGTKVIYTDHSGRESTHLAWDWTDHRLGCADRRKQTAAALRARAAEFAA
jgi:hypothetical protein